MGDVLQILQLNRQSLFNLGLPPPKVFVLVGQRPYEMGEKAMDVLLKLKKGEKVDPITIVGLDVVTKDNVDKFLK